MHYEDDVPSFSLADDDAISTQQRELRHTGKKLYISTGQLWKNDWVEPSMQSPRIRNDSVKSTIPFIIENDGSTATSDKLKDGIRWLWFKPGVANELLRRRNSLLSWYSRNTGQIGPAYAYSVHFGVNPKGLFNIFAKDIALLPDVYK